VTRRRSRHLSLKSATDIVTDDSVVVENGAGNALPLLEKT
jgi:hypothetical protein